MADENVVVRKLGELWNWVSSAVSAPAPQEPARAENPELARLADEIAKIDARILRLREDIDEETRRIQAEGVAYCRPGSRMPNAVRISVKAMLQRRGQLERTLAQAYEMRTRLQAHMHGIESAMTQRAFVSALRETQAAPQGHLTDYDVRAAEDVMEEHRELEYRAAEWNGVVAARGLGDVDDADVEAELAEMLAAPVISAMPAAVHTPPQLPAPAPEPVRHARGIDELADFM